MSRARVRSSLALIVGLPTTACSGPARVDASSPTAWSIEAVTVAANASPDSATVASAPQSIAASMAMQTIGAAFAGGFSLGDDADAPSVDRPMADSTVLMAEMCEAMDGLSANDIVASAGELAPRVTSALDRRLDSLHVEALQEARAASAAARDALDCHRSPSFTRLAIPQVYAPRFLAEVGGPPGVGSSDAAAVGVLAS